MQARSILHHAVILLLAACSTQPLPPVTSAERPVPKAELSETDFLLRWATRLRTQTNSELGAEGDALSKTYAARRNEDNRLRLALFLAIAPAPHCDRPRALALFDVAPGEVSGRGRNHPLAQLMLPLLQDLRRNEDQLAATQAKLREEQRRGEGLQQTADSLRQKLEALREIDRNLLDRKLPRKP